PQPRSPAHLAVLALTAGLASPACAARRTGPAGMGGGVPQGHAGGLQLAVWRYFPTQEIIRGHTQGICEARNSTAPEVLHPATLQARNRIGGNAGALRQGFLRQAEVTAPQ